MRKIIFIFLSICLLISVNGTAQQSKIDSLKVELVNAVTDTSRAQIMCLIGRNYEAINSDSALYSYHQALSFVETKTDSIGMGLRAKIFTDLSFMNRKQNIEKAIEYSKKALDLFIKLKKKRNELICYMNIGLHYSKIEQHAESIHYSEKGLNLGEEMKDTFFLAQCANTLGLMYCYVGVEDKALDALLLSLDMYKRINSPFNQAHTYLNLSILYGILKEPSKERKYVYKALAIYEEMEDKGRMLLCHSVLAGQYSKQGKFKKAIKSYQEILNKYDPEHAMIHIFIGSCYLSLNAMDTAKIYLDKATELLADKPNLRQASTLNTTFSKYYTQLAETSNDNSTYWEKVIFFSLNTMKFGKEAGSIQKQNEAAEYLKKAHFELGNYKKAAEYSDVYIETKDSMYNKSKAQTLINTNIRYDTKEKELKIENLNKEKAFQFSESARQKTISYAIGAILLIVFVFLIVVYVLFLQKRKANVVLISKNELITKQKKLVDQQNGEKELLLKEIHHRVKNNLQIISSLLDLQSSKIDDDTARSAIADGQSRVKSMALIHHKLYQHENIATIKIKEYIGQLFDQIMATLTTIPPKLILDIGEEVAFDIDTAIPLGLILNELFTNACKYAFEEGKQGELSISLQEREEGNYLMEVKDNGNGMPVDFDLKKARSLGLRLVRRLSKQLLGKATYKNDNGACFCIEFKNTELRKTID